MQKHLHYASVQFKFLFAAVAIINLPGFQFQNIFILYDTSSYVPIPPKAVLISVLFLTIAHCRNVRGMGRVSYIDYIENLNILTEMLPNEKLPSQL